jgi:hypothetical protein
MEGGVGPVPGKTEAYTPENPWINAKDKEGNIPDDRAAFVDVMQHRLVGARLNKSGEKPNLYLIFGFASQGYGDSETGWPRVESQLDEWCKKNDERHREAGTGWILMTQGDGDYNKKSIESIAQYARNRVPPIPVIFIQSHFGYAAPGTPYWPTYASAGFFGPGLFHDKPKLDKEGNPRMDKDGNGMKAEAWGGYVKDAEDKPTGEYGFPDAAIMLQDFAGVKIREHLGGIFVAGGGEITKEQVALYGLRAQGREGDYFVAATTVDGSESPLNTLLAPGYMEDALALEKAGGTLKVAIEPPPDLPPPPEEEGSKEEGSKEEGSKEEGSTQDKRGCCMLQF